MTVLFSIIIPTCNRKQTLMQTLDALADLRNPPPFEVVVVDDGSVDGTTDALHRRTFPFPCTCLRQDNKGPAAARNAAVHVAKGTWVAFLGDDTLPDAEWLSIHHDTHKAWRDNRPLAVVGHIGWHPGIRQTTFLRFISSAGLQFGFSLVENPDDLPFYFFYGSNVSLLRSVIVDEMFNENFRYAAWEDTELAYRLKSKQAQIVYRQDARVLHDHPIDMRDFIARQERSGYAAVTFGREHPELAGFLRISLQEPPVLRGAWLWTGMRWLACTAQRLPMSIEWLWRRLLHRHFLIGVRRAWQEPKAVRE